MNKIYTSTRNKNIALGAKDAILQGIADDGGLYVYDGLDSCKLPLAAMMDMNYEQMAQVVLKMLLPDFSDEEIMKCVEDAYCKQFDHQEITPVVKVGDMHVLELFHGPTCAFKDVGLRMLPQLMSTALKRKAQDQIMILTATSGDTGKAALAGFCDVDRIAITVFYPNHGVSNIQRLQMATQEGTNTCVCAIEGNFDDAQSNVKKIFQDENIRKALAEKNIRFSSANSINIGRLIPQIVYYIYAYKKLVENKAIKLFDEVNFCVPTGNYGNVLAGYYAKMMGLPVHKFIVASNANNVLYDFLQDGIYDRKREFYKTISPSMDILISSNLERLLYYKSGKDDRYIAQLMKELEESGKYQVKAEVLKNIQADFYGGYCSDEACIKAIRECYESYGYVMDPHTANGYKVLKEYQKNDNQHVSVLLSTASPYKFAPSVYEALYQEVIDEEFVCMEQLAKRTNTSIPQSLKTLKEKAIVHKDVIKKEAMSEYAKAKALVMSV